MYFPFFVFLRFFEKTSDQLENYFLLGLVVTASLGRYRRWKAKIRDFKSHFGPNVSYRAKIEQINGSSLSFSRDTYEKVSPKGRLFIF